MRFFSRYILWFVTSLLASCQQLPQTSVPSPTVVLPAPAPTVIPTFPSIEPLISVTPTPPVFSRLLPITADNAADLKLFSSLTQDSIHSLTWSPNGKFIVASTSHGLKLYSSLSLKEKSIRLSPSLAESFAATFSPAGTMMAWIETDNSSESGLWLWDLIKNAKSFIPIHDLQDITFSPNGSLLAGAIYEGGVQVWDTKSGKMIVSFTSAGGATDVNFGPDGRLLASAGHPDLMVHLWDMDTGAEVRTIQGPGTESYAARIEFSPDGNTLAVGYWDAVQLWDINNWTEIGYFRNPTNGIIFGLEFAPDGSYLMVFVPFESKMFMLDSGLELTATMEYVGNVAFSPDGRLVAANDSGLKLFDSSTWEVRDSLPLPLGPVQQMVFRPDKPVLVSSHEGGITVARDLGTSAEISRISNPGKHFLSPDGKLLAVGAESGDVSVWDVDAGNLLKSYQQDSKWGMSEITFSQGNRLLTIHYPDDLASKLVFWEWETDQEPRVFLFDDGLEYTGALTPDGSKLAVSIWENKIPVSVGAWDTQKRDFLWTAKRSDATWISSVALHPNGELLAVGDRWIGTISIYDAHSGTLLETLNKPDRLPDHDVPVNDIIFSNNGKFMAAIISGGPILWDLEKHTVIHVERGCIRAIESMAFSQDDTLFMIAGDKNLYTDTGGGGVCIWETQTGKLLASSDRGDTYPSKFATFNPDRAMLAIDDNDTIWLWGIFK